MIVTKWARLEDFIPSGSSPCTLNYLKLKGYKIPKDKKTRKPTTGQEGMDSLTRQYPSDPVLPLIMEARRVQKAGMYFADEHVSKDGRMHSTFTFAPDTGRLSSRRPNLNQIPQDRGDEVKVEVAKAVRSTVIATPGYVLMEADWKAIEAVLVGFFAEDSAYIKAAKLGVHDILGSHVLAHQGIWKEPIDHINWSAQKIAEWVAKYKKSFKTERNIMKTIVHGVGYGRTVYAIAKALRISQKEAQLYFDIYFKMAPRVMAWQRATRLRAHQEGFLENPFGYRRYFWDVLRPSLHPDGSWVFDENGRLVMSPSGTEANEALSFLPQSSAAGMLREALLTFDSYVNEEFYPLVPTHDSILFEILEEAAPHYLKLVDEVMGSPIPQLGGLNVEVEMKMGKNWAPFHPSEKCGEGCDHEFNPEGMQEVRLAA